MSRQKIKRPELLQVTEELLLEQGYGGFNFSSISKLLGVGRSTLYEYYGSKDDLIVDYMNELMVKYTDELSKIVTNSDANTQLILLIELMIKYAHIHSILKIIPLLKSKSDNVIRMKDNFIKDHIEIIEGIREIIEQGKHQGVVKKDIPTDILINVLFNTINLPKSLKMDNKEWAKWIWEIIYKGVKA